MPRRTIAPVLRRFLDDPDSRAEGKIEAARELRALVAVKRSARHLLVACDAAMAVQPPRLFPGRAEIVYRSAEVRRALARLAGDGKKGRGR